jgi:predicted dehydrogenase
MADWNFPENRKMKGAIFGSGTGDRLSHARMESDPVMWKSLRLQIEPQRKLSNWQTCSASTGGKFTHSHQELLEKEEIDFVDIATAPQAHYARSWIPSKGKKHVLVRNLSALTWICRQMAVEAEKAKILLRS